MLQSVTDAIKKCKTTITPMYNKNIIHVLNNNRTTLLYAIISIVLYALFAYNLQRFEHTKLLLLYSGLFTLFIAIYRSTENLKLLFVLSLLFRLVFLVATPNLSQDFYRFIWDGRLLLQGINPYLYTPDTLIETHWFHVKQSDILHTKMGTLSAKHFSNYPPFNQLCFLIAAFLGHYSILLNTIVLRALIISSDIGILFFSKKLLKQLKIPLKKSYLFILNPLVIIECTGNLHFESVMILFLVWSLYLLHHGKWQWAAFIFAFSITTKLIPLLFLPLFFRWFVRFKNYTNWQKNYKAYIPQFKKVLWFCTIIFGITLLSFLPFYTSELVNNYAKTIGLWFRNFEFNASFYYLFREVGFLFRGYNEIAIIGKILSFITLTFTLLVSFLKKVISTKTLIYNFLICLSIYLFLSTTIHPWYIITLLFLSLFTTYKFPLVWSLTIVVSYLAYSKLNVKENTHYIIIEYVSVFTALSIEYYHRLKSLKTQK